MILLLSIFLSSSFALKAAEKQIRFFAVNPGSVDPCKSKLTLKVNTAPVDSSIHILMYTLNDSSMVETLRRSAVAGKKVCIIVDEEQYNANRGKAWAMSNRLRPLLSLPNVHIRMLGHMLLPGEGSDQKKTHHDKMTIIKTPINLPARPRDTYDMMTGSYNWTYSASQRNFEQCLFMKTGTNAEINDVIDAAKVRFDDLWSRSQPLTDIIINPHARTRASRITIRKVVATEPDISPADCRIMPPALAAVRPVGAAIGLREPAATPGPASAEAGAVASERRAQPAERRPEGIRDTMRSRRSRPVERAGSTLRNTETNILSSLGETNPRLLESPLLDDPRPSPVRRASSDVERARAAARRRSARVIETSSDEDEK